MSDPKVLIIDGGELRLVRVLLNQLGIGFSHVRADLAAGTSPDAERLLVVPAQTAVALKLDRTRPKNGGPPMWLAFVKDDSRSQRRVLRQAGFDFTVPETVHPAALRLLLARAMFDGENTQRVLRVPYGGEVGYASGLFRHQALMVDVSPRGCRLLTGRREKKGAKVTVQIPTTEGGLLQLSGVVVRVREGEREGGQSTETVLGVRFDSITGRKRDQLKALLVERLSGPMTFGAVPRASSDVMLDAEVSELPQRDVLYDEDDDDEETPTVGAFDETPTLGRYEREVDAFCAGATRVLVGRDLSPDGMRICKRDDLEVGERLRLALPVDDRGAPVIIEAHVARDEGERMVILFDWMEPAERERLVEATRKLPKIHQLEPDTLTTPRCPRRSCRASAATDSQSPASSRRTRKTLSPTATFGQPHPSRRLLHGWLPARRRPRLRRRSRRLGSVLRAPQGRRRRRRGGARRAARRARDLRRGVQRDRAARARRLGERRASRGRRRRQARARRARLRDAQGGGPRQPLRRGAVRRLRAAGAALQHRDPDGVPCRRRPDDGDGAAVGRRRGHPDLRVRGAAPAVPAGLRERRLPGRHGPDRAAGGLGPGRHRDARDRRGRALLHRRPEDLHHERRRREIHLVLARDDDTFEQSKGTTRGLSLFIVPRTLPDGTPNGVALERLEHKLGLHGSPTAVVRFDRAEGFRIGRKSEGFKAMLQLMNNARLGVAAQGIGIAEAALDEAIRYSKERKQFGIPIGDQPLMKNMLARMVLGVEGSRALLYRTCELIDRNRSLEQYLAREGDQISEGERAEIERLLERNTVRIRLLTPLAKYLGTETADEVTRMAVQIHGGLGFMAESVVGRLHLDGIITTIYEGTSEIQISFALKEIGKGALGIVFEEIGAELDKHTDEPLAGLAAQLRTGIERINEASVALLQDFNYALLCSRHVAEMVIAVIVGAELLKQASLRPERADLAASWINRRMLELETHARRVSEGTVDRIARCERIVGLVE